MPIERLPSELLSAVFSHLDRASLYALTQSARVFTSEAQYALLQRPTLRNLPSFLLLLAFLSADAEHPDQPDPAPDDRFRDEERISDVQARKFSSTVAHAHVICRDYGTRGWGVAVGRFVRECPNLASLRLDGIEDLRMRQLAGATMLKLELKSTSFRAHSLPFSPPLPFLTHLGLDNMGLPTPATHLQSLLAASPKLVSLSISFLRDLTPKLFSDALQVVQPSLRILKIGVLTEKQDEVLPDLLAGFEKLESLDLTCPIPLLRHLTALPESLRSLSLHRSKAGMIKEEEETREAVAIFLTKGDCKKLKELTLWEGRGLRRLEDLASARSIKAMFTN